MQNDSYRRLEEFTRLEKNNELEFAKKNLKNYDSMLQIDLQEFNNASEFRDYIKANEAHIDKAEAIFIGWLFVLIAEIATMVVHLLSWIRNKIFTNK